MLIIFAFDFFNRLQKSIEKNYRTHTLMRGRELTRPTTDLGLIFFHIRTTRDIKTRRSWQRRARLALAQRADLSPAERHEVMCVWSRADSHLIHSDALNKLLGTRHKAYALHLKHKTPTLRARFDATGRLSREKKPGFTRLYFGDAANSSVYILDTPPRWLDHDTLSPTACHAPPHSPPHPPAIARPRALRGSGSRCALTDDSRLRSRRPAWRAHNSTRTPWPRQVQAQLNLW